MDYINIFYPESRFGGFSDIDGVVSFYCRVNSLVQPSFILLDIGCGRGLYAEQPNTFKRKLRIFKGKCKKVIGIDVDKSASANPFIDEFHIIKDNHWPLESDSINLAICNSVLEHVEDPDSFFSECQRVIKPGGYLCLTTTNALGYVCMISKLIPNKYHNKVLRKIGSKRKEIDTFPTFYKCNTIHKLRKMLTKHGFDHCVYGCEAEPGYLSFSKFLYCLGVLHQRFCPGMFKIAIFAFARKKY
jgi:SAM-dependent methyltransferase